MFFHPFDTCFPDAEVIRLVLDTLHPHTLAALQEAFGAEAAQRTARRVGSRQTLEQETAAWEAARWRAARNACAQCLRAMPARNARHADVNWRFTTDKARQKLRRLYQPEKF